MSAPWPVRTIPPSAAACGYGTSGALTDIAYPHERLFGACLSVKPFSPTHVKWCAAVLSSIPLFA